MHKVTWRNPALSDLGQIINYTNREWGYAQAGKIIDLFEQTTRFLAGTPLVGRKARRKNVYILTLSKVPYVLVYEIIQDEIFVTQVIHMSKRR
jgi:plasmid stabilization system protein ParE